MAQKSVTPRQTSINVADDEDDDNDIKCSQVNLF